MSIVLSESSRTALDLIFTSAVIRSKRSSCFLNGPYWQIFDGTNHSLAIFLIFLMHHLQYSNYCRHSWRPTVSLQKWKIKQIKSYFSIWKTVKFKISHGRKSQLVVSCQAMTNPCCSWVVIFCGFFSYLIGYKAMNIQELSSGICGFMIKTVVLL